MKKSNMDMLHGSIGGKLFRFAMPIAFTIIFEQLVNTTDVLVLGQFVGTAAMAAVGNDGPILALLISLLVGMSLGANVVIAQHIGAKEEESISGAVHTAVLFSVLVGLAFSVIGELFTNPILSILDVPQEVYWEAEIYLRIFFLALPFLSLYNFEAAIFRASGDGKTPLYTLIAASVVNAVLDVGLSLMGCGIVGVVAATVVSYVLDAALLFALLTRRSDVLALRPARLRIRKRELSEIIRIGLPAGIQGMVFSISNVLIQSAINSLGPEVMAASSAAFTIEANVYAFVNSFGQATTTFVGQNFGAKQLKRCFAILRKAMGIEFIFVAFLGGVCSLLAPQIMKFFTADQAVITYGITRIYLVTGLQCINGISEVFSGALRGYGYSLPPALVVLFTVCGTRVFWVETIFRKWPTYEVLMVNYPMSWFITGVLMAFVYTAVKRVMEKTYPGNV